MKTSMFGMTLLALTAAMASPAAAAEVLVNGGFDNGLTGWTSYVTDNGTIAEIPSTPGAPAPQTAAVVAFDVDGDGAASDALFLNAGKSLPPYGISPWEGGGVSQVFQTNGGLATFSVDIAAFYSRSSGALNLGLLSVLLDGKVMDSHDFGGVDAGPATLRSTLSFSTRLAAGEHTLSLQALRPYAPGRGVASQHFDNASLDVAAVPEPGAWALMLLGFGGAGAVLRRRRCATA